ncbi:MAG: radical SAM protein, partial [Gemmataceae bacterium]
MPEGRPDSRGSALKLMPSPLETLFFGGGTPTHPRPDEMRRLFEMTHKYFRVSATTEFSVEANPLDLTDEKIDLLAEMGVNRISLGVQSFSPQA